MTDPPLVTLPGLLAGVVRNLPHAPRQLATLPAALRADGERVGGIGAMVARNARRWPFRAAVLFEGQRWSWRRLDRAADRYARALVQEGVQQGTVVPVLSGNRPQVLIAVAALAKLGAVAALINPDLPPAVLAELVPPGPRFVDVERIPAVVPGPGLALLDPDQAPPPGWTDPGDGGFALPPTTRVRLREPALHVFTSGTTGLPKAAVMTHLRWQRAATLYGPLIVGLRPGQVVYCPLPLFHNLALTATWGGVVASGATLALARSFSARRYWAEAKAVGATAIPYIGELPRYLLAQPPSPADRDHAVRSAFGVGMPPASWAEFQRRFGVTRVLETYAASEANTGFFNAFGQVGSVGFCPSSYALLRYDVDAGEVLRDRRGRPRKARRGEVGLLVGKVTPRFDFDGYADAEASERKLRRDLFRRGDAWVDTGDLLLNQGWRHAAFVDRLGDTFRWKSENVSTQQVEAALRTVPGVEACVVYGVRVPGQAGRAGMAAIVGAPDPATLLSTLQAQLPEPAIPVFLRSVDAIRTTPTHKPRKGPLQADGYTPDGVLARLDGGYRPLDAELRRRLAGGDLRLG